MDFSDKPGPEEFFTRFPLNFDYLITSAGELRLMVSRDGRPDSMCLTAAGPVEWAELDDPGVALAIICAYVHNAPPPVCKRVADFFTAEEMEFLLYADGVFAEMSGQSMKIQ